MPDLGVVVPFYNEEKNAAAVVHELIAALRRSRLDFELALVTDGSTDRTAAELLEATRGVPGVTVLSGPHANGYGAAILRGLEALKSDIVGWTDGDGQVPASTITEIYDAMRRSRAALGMGLRKGRDDGWMRSLASRGYNWLMRRMLGVAFPDINAKPKLVEARLLRQLSLRSHDWFIDTELVIGTVLRGEPVIRVPVPFLARAHGKSKVSPAILREYWKNLRAFRSRLRLQGLAAGPASTASGPGADRKEQGAGSED